MTILYITIPSLIVITVGLYFFWLYIKSEYRKYDREESLKEEIARMKGLINDAMDYFYEHYNNDFDSSVYRNIKTKMDFLKPVIEKKPTERKLYYYKKLYQRLYETEYRLRTNFDNVSFVLMPLNSLINEIAQEQIDFIRENSDI